MFNVQKNIFKIFKLYFRHDFIAKLIHIKTYITLEITQPLRLVLCPALLFSKLNSSKIYYSNKL
jgi:hypothetical protein